MTFDEKLVKQFTDFMIKTPNHPIHLKHLYADYVELNALLSNEDYITYADILDRLNDNEVKITNLEEEVGEIEDIASLENEVDSSKESWVNSIFDIIYVRERIYGVDYPFSTEANRLKLNENLSLKQKLYLSLLLASNLNIFTRISPELTSEFETISYYALKNFLPNKATVRQFGKNSDYKGNAIDKIKSLANDMKIEVNEATIKRNISSKNNQERGLDVIGWVQLKIKFQI